MNFIGSQKTLTMKYIFEFMCYRRGDLAECPNKIALTYLFWPKFPDPNFLA